MIIVTGATGHLGGAIVEKLLEKMPASKIGVSVRDLARAAPLAARNVRVRQGDFVDSESLRHAFEGATQVLIVSANTMGPDALRQHQNAIDAAKAVGARRILYTSHMAAAHPDPRFGPSMDHAATEAMLEVSGVPYTSLRNGFYTESALMLMGPWRETGEIVTPQDAPVSWTARHDLAEAAAVVLANEGMFEGPTPPLVAAEAVDFAALAAMASEVAGRTIARTLVNDVEYEAKMVARGVPAPVAGMLTKIFATIRVGGLATEDPTLAELLGRATTPARVVIATPPAPAAS